MRFVVRRICFVVGLVAIGVACSDDDSKAVSNTPLPDRNGQDGGSSGTDGGAVSADAAPSFTYVDFELNHVLITGQSNSVGNGATPPASTTQPFTNVMFDTGPMSMSGCDGEGCMAFDTPTKLVPLVEGDKFFDYEVETPASGLANEISHLATTRHGKAKHDVLASVHGRSGNTYACLRKGNCDYKPGYLSPFEQGMKEVTAGKQLAGAKSYAVRGVFSIHGESDHNSYGDGSQEFPMPGTDGKSTIADYSDGLVEWQRDYEASIKEITKQTIPVPLFISQISGWNDGVTSKLAQWQLDAHTKAPGKVILVTPGYAIPIDQGDCLHYTNEGTRRLGEYFAKAYAQTVFEGRAWEPLRPTSIKREGAVITVQFVVPKPPLVFDVDQVAAAENQGFTVTEGSITKVELSGQDAVKITLAAAPTGTDKRLRYAMNQTPQTCAGTPIGARGNLRDSDDTPSKQGYKLQNWSVHFDLPIP